MSKPINLRCCVVLWPCRLSSEGQGPGLVSTQVSSTQAHTGVARLICTPNCEPALAGRSHGGVCFCHGCLITGAVDRVTEWCTPYHRVSILPYAVATLCACTWVAFALIQVLWTGSRPTSRQAGQTTLVNQSTGLHASCPQRMADRSYATRPCSRRCAHFQALRAQTR